MEMNATAAYSNPFKILGEQYLSLHMGQIKKPEKNLVSQRKSINSLNWAALKIEDVPTEM